MTKGKSGKSRREALEMHKDGRKEAHKKRRENLGRNKLAEYFWEDSSDKLRFHAEAINRKIHAKYSGG